MLKRILSLTLVFVLTVTLFLPGCFLLQGGSDEEEDNKNPSSQINDDQSEDYSDFDYEGVWRLKSVEYEGATYVGDEIGTIMTYYFFSGGQGAVDIDDNFHEISWTITKSGLLMDNGTDKLTFTPDKDNKLTVSENGFYMVFECDYGAFYLYERPQGSAKYLEGRNLVVSIFVDVEGYAWTDADIKALQPKYNAAKDFLETEAEKYGKSLDLICDPVANPDIAYRASLDWEIFELAASGTGEGGTGQDLVKYVQTINALNNYIENNVKYVTLARKYQTSSIAYCFQFKNWASISYEFNYNPDILSKGTYHEKVVIFGMEKWGEELLPHELLHAFGAVDLYQESTIHGVSSALVEYAKKNYPNDIMRGWEELLVSDKVEFEIGPITAYCLGWLDDIPELSTFPELKRHTKAAFYDHGRVISEEQIKSGDTFPSSGGSKSISGITEFKFTPDHTDIWILSSSDCGDSKPMVELYDSNKQLIGRSRMGGGGNNGYYAAYLDKGVTYYLRASFVDPSVGDNAKGSYTLNMKNPETLSGSGGQAHMENGARRQYYFTPNESGTWEFMHSNTNGADIYYTLFSVGDDGKYSITVGQAQPEYQGQGRDKYISVQLEAGKKYLLVLASMDSVASYTVNVSKK